MEKSISEKSMSEKSISEKLLLEKFHNVKIHIVKEYISQKVHIGNYLSGVQEEVRRLLKYPEYIYIEKKHIGKNPNQKKSKSEKIYIQKNQKSSIIRS